MMCVSHTVHLCHMRSRADTDAKLYWAIRGGGGNFGIVLTFALQLHPQPADVLCGLLVWPVPISVSTGRQSEANEDEEEARVRFTYDKVIQACERFQMRAKEGEETLWVMFAGAAMFGKPMASVRDSFLFSRPSVHGWSQRRSTWLTGRSTCWCLPSTADRKPKAESASKRSSSSVRSLLRILSARRAHA
jgi:hypothetical protein